MRGVDSSTEGQKLELTWHGMLRRESCTDWYLAARDALADAARAANWAAVFRVLKQEPSFVNGWRIGGTSWFTPLHQAAYHGASVSVVEQLLKVGAWRTVRSQSGERPADVAKRRGHARLAAHLRPARARRMSVETLERMQRRLHDVMRHRIAALEGVLESLRLPELAPLTEYRHAKMWFAVPGMYGGFRFWLKGTAGRTTLVSESWCRVVEGSGERYEITPDGAQLVDKGFV